MCQLQETISIRAEQSHSEHVVRAPIGAQDANKYSEVGAQDTKIPPMNFPYTVQWIVYIALISWYQIGIRRGERQIKIRTGFFQAKCKL
jgi:hypothetical protein